MTQAAALPADIRAMNALAAILFAGVGAALLAGLLAFAAQQPLFAIRSVEIEGEVTRNSVSTIRANALPMLAGNFFSLDLERARRAFESVPWVRRATLRRIWPNRLAVRLEEHRAAAYWQGEGDEGKLVNTEGEVFEVNLGDVEDDALPSFEGPDGSARAMLRMYRRLDPLLARIDAHVETLELSGRGSWRAGLSNGATLEIGRGAEDELLARTERFVRSYGQIDARFERPLAYADLRHADGYAVRLKGVSTLADAAPSKRHRN
jgi:cell division protein FtsQ